MDISLFFRCVPHQQRSFGLGIQLLFGRLLGRASSLNAYLMGNSIARPDLESRIDQNTISMAQRWNTICVL